jgi:uncharacterized membrane protein
MALSNRRIIDLRAFMKTVSMSKCMSQTKVFVGAIVLGLVVGLLPFVIVLMYMGVILLMYKPEKYGGNYMPFVLAGVIAAIAGLVFTTARIDDLKKEKQNLVDIGALYAFAALALIAFGLIFPVYDGLVHPCDVYYISFIFLVLTLVAFCVLSLVATCRFIPVLWRILWRRKRRKTSSKDTLEK